MLQRSDSTFTASQSLNAAYHVIASELNQVEQIICQELSDHVPFVDEVVRYAFRLGGKRLRPAMLLLAGKAIAPLQQEHVFSAAAIELIHTATLIHDDILDGAEIRRHLMTMNLRWNTEISVMAGDLLFAKAMAMVTRLNDIYPYRVIAKACQETCYGELYQMGTRSRFDLGTNEYFKMIALKTAALLECACHLGAVYSKASETTVHALCSFARNLGIAFQIIDDVLDIDGDEKQTGKTLGTDLARKKPTLPLIIFLESLASEERETMITELKTRGGDDVFATELAKRLQTSGSIDAAKNQAKNLVETAVFQLGTISQNEIHSPDAIQSLIALSRFVTDREK